MTNRFTKRVRKVQKIETKSPCDNSSRGGTVFNCFTSKRLAKKVTNESTSFDLPMKHTRELNVYYKPHGFFGFPRHFHLLLCNCLVLSVQCLFCGKKRNERLAQKSAPVCP